MKSGKDDLILSVALAERIQKLEKFHEMLQNKGMSKIRKQANGVPEIKEAEDESSFSDSENENIIRRPIKHGGQKNTNKVGSAEFYNHSERSSTDVNEDFASV